MYHLNSFYLRKNQDVRQRAAATATKKPPENAIKLRKSPF